MITDKQKAYREWYQKNRETELKRKRKKSCPLSILTTILSIWEEQGIPENQWHVYEEGCKAIGRMPKTAFKIGGPKVRGCYGTGETHE